MQSMNVLRALRKAKNFNSKADVASLLKTSRQYYSDYECEKFELPLHHLVFLADYYHVSTDYLLGKTNIKTPYQAK